MAGIAGASCSVGALRPFKCDDKGYQLFATTKSAHMQEIHCSTEQRSRVAPEQVQNVRRESFRMGCPSRVALHAAADDWVESLRNVELRYTSVL
jgi:hypothetical protein